MAEELNEVFTLENKEMGSLLGHKQFITFVAKWEKKYPILKVVSEKVCKPIFFLSLYLETLK